jgi:hypothetical protein
LSVTLHGVLQCMPDANAAFDISSADGHPLKSAAEGHPSSLSP